MSNVIVTAEFRGEKDIEDLTHRGGESQPSSERILRVKRQGH